MPDWLLLGWRGGEVKDGPERGALLPFNSENTCFKAVKCFFLIVDGLYVETPTVSPSPSFLCFPSTGVFLSGGNLGTDGKKARRRRRRRMMAEGAWVGRRCLERGKGLKFGAGARGWLQAHRRHGGGRKHVGVSSCRSPRCQNGGGGITEEHAR